MSHFLSSLPQSLQDKTVFVIASIVISTSIAIIGGLIGLRYWYGKEKWRTRRQLFQRELEECAAENTTTLAAEVEVATTTACVRE